MTPLERAVEAIRGAVFESSAVAEHMHQDAALRAARAVLGAIREPSEAMAESGRYALCAEPDTSTDTNEAATCCWQAMLDEVLNETKAVPQS